MIFKVKKTFKYIVEKKLNKNLGGKKNGKRSENNSRKK